MENTHRVRFYRQETSMMTFLSRLSDTQEKTISNRPMTGQGGGVRSKTQLKQMQYPDLRTCATCRNVHTLFFFEETDQ